MHAIYSVLLLLAAIAAPAILAADAAAPSVIRHYRFTECLAQDRFVHTPIMATVDYKNDNTALIQWNFCATSATALMHTRSARLLITDDNNGKTLLNQAFSLCPNRDCYQQAKATSCIAGSHQLTWVKPPTATTNTQLMLQDGQGKTTGEFCQV